ncbi:cilia- and flagella-associated protein 52-like isoform X1 [Patagioenas fasciata]|uniref:cilia- and flagella-associated protein 52-like isoform X1 n=1 Tax=Patagioenas fasciata TaxID=372321 RepID=UPI0032E8B7FE
MAAAKGDGAVGELELQAAIGFNGHVPCGLICHPDKEHILYPLGCTVVIQHLDTQKQSFLHGHTNNVSCVAVSRDGTYVASGQVTCIGFKADIILWDFPKQELLARLSLHEGKVEGLSFSPRGIYLVSLGGQDDGRVMVWDVSKREAVCGSPASPRSAGNANVVVCSSCRDEMFVTAGNFTIRVWELDTATKKIHPSECYAGQLKRIAMCVQVTNDDDDFYLGTTSGDVLKVNTSSKVVTACGPQKKFSMGVTALLLLKTGGLIVGTGEGTVALCTGSDFQVKKRMRVEGGVTSLTCRGRDDQFFIGTNKCQMYRSAYATFKEELVAVCHTEAVNDIVFPAGHSDLFVTCSTNDIRVWYTPERWERLRITVPNVTCQAVEVTRDGMVILSAWNDGKIRAFVPATGEPMYEINNAHNLGVTAIAATSDCKQIISGGGDGQVRIWNIGEKTQKLREILKEHRGAMSCIKINKNDKEGVTASLDGTCVIWDLVRYVRKQMILDNTLFKCVCYHPGEYQIITSGTDRKIVYWEVLDGSAIREVQGSLSSSINGMDITSDGASFVTGGDDHLVKLWDYQEGAVTHVGVGHSGSITRLKICPANKFIVSVSADGAVLTWKYPSSG